MTWEWSHTQDAYDNAHNNLWGLDRETLQIIWAEWHSSEYPDGGEEREFDVQLYKFALSAVGLIDTELLIDFIWQDMERNATCDNGGYNAWCCPFGCHTVSFDREVETTEQERAE